MQAPVSLCIIVKSDPLLEDCVKSLRPFVREIVIVDTGSPQEYQEKIRPLADIFDVYTECNNGETGLIEDFAKARQRSFDLATQSWIIWTDSDDVVEGGENLFRLISAYQASQSSLDAVGFVFPYEYAYDETGRCTLKHYRERLISNKKFFHWVNPVHEVLIDNPGNKTAFITDDSIVWKHRRQFSNKPVESGRNLRILKKYVEGAGANDARQLYYLGLEYCANGFMDAAIETLVKYIDVSGWDDERVMACLKLVDIYQAITQYQNALKWAFKAIEINEHWAEGYFAIGRMFYFLAMAGGNQAIRHWQRCAHFIRTGLTMPETKTLLFINPLEREIEIYKYLNVALNAVGDVKGALEATNKGIEKHQDTMLLSNKKLYQQFLLTQQIDTAINELRQVDGLTQASSNLMLDLLHKRVSTETTKLQPEETSKIQFSTQMPDRKLDIVFAIGQGVEEWTPTSVKRTGIGGSEAMAIEISKRLASQGHRVRLYNSCGFFGEGKYDGVEYLQTEKYRNITCDVLIASRRADFIDEEFHVQAKLKLLWVHDIYAINANPQRLNKFDKLLALSNWHKQVLQNIHQLPESKIITTRNGIDLQLFKKDGIKRDRYKTIASSSPDRYLPVLLEIWPEIKKRVPAASLDIAYGFKNWLFVAENDQKQLDLIHRLQKQMDEMKSLDVVFHDRVSHEQLAEMFLGAGVWTYSTWFSETSCRTAMEAQAAGLRMISSPIAALNETVGQRGVLIPGDWTSREYQNQFIDAVVNAMENEEDTDRLVLQKYAEEHFDLDSLANEWNAMFHQLLNKHHGNSVLSFDQFCSAAE